MLFDTASLAKSSSSRGEPGIGHAILVRINSLEGVVANAVGAIVTPIPSWALAMILAHEARINRRLGHANMFETLGQEHILAPQTEIQASFLRLPCASVRALSVPTSLVFLVQGCDGRFAKDLDGAMHAESAIVDVSSALVLHQDGH